MDHSSTTRPAIDDKDESLFGFTRGRFVQDEERQMAMRYQRFDPYELAKVASHAMGGSLCVRLEKLTDGLYNKVFTLGMDSGVEVIAKIPHSNAGLPHLTTASEVATMEFARSVLHIPVPKVLAWCSRAEESAVGAEYIIMEKADGIPLGEVYRDMGVSDRYAIIQAIGNYQVKWAKRCYRGYGSLYFASDLDGAARIGQPLSAPNDNYAAHHYAIGPTNGRDWHDNDRSSVRFDRGPWNTAEEYFKAVGHREMSCVKESATLPFTSASLCGPNTYQRTREKKTTAINHYLDLLQDIIPADTAITQPVLWHADLHAQNIFVDPKSPTTITSIIDWQSTEIAPLLVQACQPQFLDYEGPQVVGLERPKLPQDFDQLSSDQQRQAKKFYTLQSLSALYRKWLQVNFSDACKAMDFQETPTYDLLLFARNLLVDGEAIYMGRLLEIADAEPDKLGKNNLSFSEDARATILADAEASSSAMDLIAGIRDTLGELYPRRGILVWPEQYDEVKDALRQMKEQVIEQYATTEEEQRTWEEMWPWDG